MIQPYRAAKFRKFDQNRTQVVVDYLTEHGPTPRRIAIEAFAQAYWDRHITGHSVSIETTKYRMADHLREMEKSKELLRGPRPKQVLSLPGQETE
jgi:hypothetical protein